MRTRAVHPLAIAALVFMSVVWGSTFFSIKELVTRIPVPDMLGVRFSIAAVVTGAMLWRHWRMSAATLRHGLLVGLVFGLAQVTQTIGLAHTAASVSGFLTGLYVVFTPLLAATFLRQGLGRSTWWAVGMAAAGLATLTLSGGAGHRFGIGEILTLVCALLYAIHIILVARYARPDNALSITNVQGVVVALVCLASAAPGGIQVPASRGDWLLLFYLAIVAGSLTLFLQIWAQARVAPTTAAVIMSGEPVWAAAFAVALGGEHLTWRTVVGGVCVVSAMLLVTLGGRSDASSARPAKA